MGFLGIKEIVVEASDGQSEERTGRVLVQTKRVAPAPKFKRHWVSAVWDFPSERRRVAA
ncbi:hypothetical protein J1N35_041422 [Gossypium stocksii]|uniref:Uncharacterized protein n=1 Tax=Gossypium stocksii TaxID=47602 RepID=A0A9D3UFG6_9ROSI|nr:hypothetical protein J1N35_041422 [Gossypium stocksii]